ncbi:MAG: preprotein translocase subunit SecE [Candidatus Magasanikbacteria bacterium CG10_big_fil_rev_8_21_14_0_10_43_6]|uniref:Protein translocase subunit SecE n=1 Tax=Candidatus Magasanikbacteria bacterium CG10_big_fil_rev_8_21_14_0_10_43_6 TaxID=1974650 RepID=A0A2M6W0P2_9BACT|nr:MAG: preprotein translocase subunit SecE [Candidatus Magasanikbacteria bacterium CG10_big_fil_rev_8_21_14_0_10_43_6]
MLQLKDYFREAIGEMRKVTWPTQKQVKFFSILVIAMSLGVAVFFGVLDYVLNYLLGLII